MLVAVVLPLVLAFIMFSLGLGLKGSDFARVLQQPKVIATGLANQLILLPLVAFGLVHAFGLPPLLALATQTAQPSVAKTTKQDCPTTS